MRFVESFCLRSTLILSHFRHAVQGRLRNADGSGHVSEATALWLQTMASPRLLGTASSDCAGASGLVYRRRTVSGNCEAKDESDDTQCADAPDP